MVVKLGNSKDHVHLGFLVVVVVVGFAATSCEAVKPKQLDVATCNAQHVVNRSAFPPNFLFGSASAAYQVEGGAKGGGRGPSNWDTFMHKYPEKIADHSTGDVAIDEYRRYKEDVQIMKDMGMDAYRFSISWSRLLPNGKLSGGVNKEGIKYYKSLIHELLHNGIQPFVTIFHWDVPQALDNEYGGFLSPNIVNDFRDYAELCFREFGNKVKHWITINEPWSICKNGYATGAHAPGRCSNKTCTGGNSGTEPYMVAHNLLLAHAAAVKLYRDKYQAVQKGVIGITIITHWFVPYSKTKQDEDAASRALDFMFGWFMDPLVNGRYPVSMRSLVGNRLPKFTKEQVKMLKGSYDFIGINYYTAYYAVNVPPNKNAKPDYNTDGLHNLVAARDGVPIGPRAASFWLYVYPKGFRELLIHTKRKYNNPLIYITENGVSERNDPKLSLEEALVDNLRINYYDQHLYYLHLAIKEGVNVKGYFAWSIFDNLEWSDGYTMRFGLNFIDYKNGLKRHPKLSALWFKNFLNKQKPDSKHKPS